MVRAGSPLTGSRCNTTGRPGSADRYLRYFNCRSRYQDIGHGKLSDVGPVAGRVYCGLTGLILWVAVCCSIVNYNIRCPDGQT